MGKLRPDFFESFGGFLRFGGIVPDALLGEFCLQLRYFGLGAYRVKDTPLTGEASPPVRRFPESGRVAQAYFFLSRHWEYRVS
jgi:hypothetical protein